MSALTALQPGAQDVLREHPMLDQAYQFWKARSGERAMPHETDLDAVALPLELMPWSILTEVLETERDFRYALLGSAIIQMARRDFTGCRFSELDHIRPGSQLWTQRATVANLGQPMLVSPPYTGPLGDVRRVYDLHLPLSADNGRVGMIWTVVAFERI
ncbi:hypothetical protein [Azospirillum sp. SYSU D00513]|uniref:hypothetical protein n=1 Tax=Azospirillum sp. SYSU D00513 TaxID=2812561 RepID=UPI001A95DAF8|nr:hypothetical protein [Azospirillum sp. SYSU D00513]